MRRAVVVLALAWPTSAHADSTSSSVTVTLNARGQQFATQYGLSEQRLTMLTEQGISDIYQTQHLGQLLRAFANTGAFADRGLGADYQADPDTWMLGVVATGALASDVSLGSSSHVVYGAVVNIGGVVGTSLARWGAPRWQAFASGSYEDTTIKSMHGSLITGGAHAQYKLIAGSAPAVVRWTGLDVTGGIEISRWDVGEAKPIKINFKVYNATMTDSNTVDLISNGTLSVTARTYSVPIEVTTGVRLLGVLAIYGGGGIALTTGSSAINARLSGTMTINNDMEPIGTAVITGTGTSGPDAVSVHALAGVELHTRYFRFFVQGALAPSEEAVTVGLRAVP
jgi:hypothetical protein